MTYTPPSHVASGTASSGQFNTEVIDNIVDLNSRLSDVEGGWSTFTPTFYLGSNPIPGNTITEVGFYKVIGDAWFLSVDFTVTSVGTWPADDTFNMAMPFGVRDGATAGRLIGGTAKAVDTSGSYYPQALVEIGVAANHLVFRGLDGVTIFTGTSPFTWAAGDKFYLEAHGVLA